MNMRILLLRPPRYVWPFNSETSAFWQPLGLLSLAAAVRREIPQAEIQVWDCPAERCGWRSLEKRLAEQRIDVLGIGEETVSAHEAIRAARLVKTLNPECLVVAGGMYFSYTIEESLHNGVIDIIVRGEGEKTFVELLSKRRDRPAWHTIPGIAFRDEQDRVIITPVRKLIPDLDSLPFPAYDLIDMQNYGCQSKNHPGLVSIEHSRGCIDSCDFCILWKHMGQSVNGNGRFRPCWRTKSSQHSFEEVYRLVHDFNRRTFGWVDPTFNARPEWSDAWSDLMLRSPLVTARGAKTVHTAWLRADGVVRDEKLGILKKLVRAGLRQVMIGIERDDDSGLACLHKTNNHLDICREAFALLRENYPEVYTIGTMIYGLPNDTAADLKRLVTRQYELGVDYCFMIPLTPNPGTEVAQRAARNGTLSNPDRSSYNFHTPVCRTESLTLRDLENIYWKLMFRPDARRLVRSLKIFFRERNRRKRKVHLSLLRHGTRIAAKSFTHRLFHPKHHQPTLFSRRPSWYDK